jgi:hypothetical protein
VTVTPDGKTANAAFKDMSAPNGKVVEFKGSQVLVAPGPKGSHASAGTWKNAKVQSMSDDAVTVTMKDNGKTLTLTSPTGTGYTATFGGPAVPIRGDLGGTKAAVRKIGADTIVETDTRDGKTVSTATMKLDGPGRMTISNEDTLRGTRTVFPANKQ